MTKRLLVAVAWAALIRICLHVFGLDGFIDQHQQTWNEVGVLLGLALIVDGIVHWKD